MIRAIAASGRDIIRTAPTAIQRARRPGYTVSMNETDEKPTAPESRLARRVRRETEKLHLAHHYAASAGLAPGMTVLDAGAGTGALSLVYAEIVGPQGHVIALDPDADLLAWGAAEAKRRAIPLETRAVSAAAPLDPALQADRIFAADMLHHMAEPERALAVWRGALRPGGRLVVAEYDKAGPGEFGPPPEHRIATDDLVRMIEAARFRIAQVAQAPDEHVLILAEPAP